MPKETFFNLAKEKQERILSAARIEFSRADLKDASVNQIIKLADIPRGSFYQYFEDKEDLYFYYLSNLGKQTKMNFETAFKESRGDFFVAVELFSTTFMTMILEGPDKEFYGHVFTGMDFHSSDKALPFNHPPHPHRGGPKELPEFLKTVDFEKLKLESPEELMILFKLVMTIFVHTIAEAYKPQEDGTQLSKEEVLRRFNLRLNWLKYGAYQKPISGKEEK